MIHISIDDRMVRITKDVHRFQPFLYFFDLAFEHFAIHHHAAVGARQPFARAVEDRSLSLPRHKILRIHFVEAEFGEWMALTEWSFEWLAVTHRYFVLVRARLSVIRHEVNVYNPRMGIIDGHANLRAIGLAQNGGKKQRMLFDLTVSETAPLDDAVVELLHFILDQVVDSTASGVFDFETIGHELLMEDMQVRRVDGIFHRLQPIAVELRQSAQPMPAVGSRPDVVLRDKRRRLRSQIGPIQTCQFLHWISFLLHRKAKVTSGGLR